MNIFFLFNLQLKRLPSKKLLFERSLVLFFRNNYLFVKCMSGRTEDINVFVHVHFLKLVACWSQVFAWVKFIWVLKEHFADCGCHCQAAVRVNVDFANSRLCCLSKLLFRNAN